MTTDISVFAICALLLMVAGTRLARDGDVVADKTGIGGVWIGAVIIALATSLPELVFDITAASRGFIDLAVGDIFGSGLSNMLILAIVDALFVMVYVKRRSGVKKTSGGHVAVASLAIALTTLAAIFMLLPSKFAVMSVGFGTIVIAVAYISGVWLMFKQDNLSSDLLPAQSPRSLPAAIAGIVVSALVIFTAAPFMVGAAQRLAIYSGLGATFFGTLFLASVTSFPELVVSFTAIRLGAFDLAVGNLFGSNAFNVFILVFVDAAFRKGPLLSSVNEVNIVTALFLILMMGVGLVSAAAKSKQRNALLLPDSVLLVALYVSAMYTVYALS